MTVSENIRALGRDGLPTADIARRLGISYQHAYNVLKASGRLPAASREGGTTPMQSGVTASSTKPPLTVSAMIAGGFTRASHWSLSNTNDPVLAEPLPRVEGVYAFANQEVALYVGVATMGLAKRLYFYGRPGKTQRTSQRINDLLRTELLTEPRIDIYIAVPPDLDWNGLPVHGSAGLELGLIKKHALRWNMRSAG